MAVADSGSGLTRRQSKHNRGPAQLAYYLYQGGRACAEAGTSVPRARTAATPAEVEAAGAAGCEANSMPDAIGRSESGLFCLRVCLPVAEPPNEIMPAWVGHGVGASARSSGRPRAQGACVA